MKGKDYYVRFYPFIKRKNFTLVYFDSYKITLSILIERISKKLAVHGIPKKLIKSFCSELKKEIKKELKSYEPCEKRKYTKKKTDTHLFKGKSEFYITMHEGETLQNGNRELGYLFLENLFREIKGCRIINKKSVRNVFNLSKLKLGNDFRLHQNRYCFSSREWDKYNLNSRVRHKNLTIWKPNAQCVMVSIESKQDKALCNLELLSKGFSQIAERYNILETYTILKLVSNKQCSNEIGINVLSSEVELRELGFELFPKTYDIYGIKFWFDNSITNEIELDISFNCELSNVIKTFNLINEYKEYIRLLEKGILTIEPFSLENNLLPRSLSLEAKRSYEKRDFYNLVKTFYIQLNWIFLRLT